MSKQKGKKKVECKCKDWEENIPKINSFMAMGMIHGMSYKGKQFKYCPWCRKEL